jgi:hypothetical protein
VDSERSIPTLGGNPSGVGSDRLRPAPDPAGVAPSRVSLPPFPEEVHRWSGRLLAAVGVYTGIVTALLLAVATLDRGLPVRSRAILLMGAVLVVTWVGIGGVLQYRGRERVRRFVVAHGGSDGYRFVVFAAGLALVEEAITTSLTNLAPLFGTPVGVAYITASPNYLDVVLFNSVIVFLPMFAAWALLLARWDFRPLEVFLLYGLVGSLGEGILSPVNALAGFWFFVYGLFVYLPAYSLRTPRNVPRPRWYHFLLAVVLPLLLAVPVAIVVLLVRQALGLHFFSG